MNIYSELIEAFQNHKQDEFLEEKFYSMSDEECKEIMSCLVDAVIQSHDSSASEFLMKGLDLAYQIELQKSESVD